MAAGNRNKKGHAVDYVRHYMLPNSKILCGKKSFGYASTQIDDVTCKLCLKKQIKI